MISTWSFPLIIFGSGVSREPYKSLFPCLSVLRNQFWSLWLVDTNFEQRRLPVPEPVLSNSTCWIMRQKKIFCLEKIKVPPGNTLEQPLLREFRWGTSSSCSCSCYHVNIYLLLLLGQKHYIKNKEEKLFSIYSAAFKLH